MNWREAVIEYIRNNARPVDKYDHQPRLYALTRQVGANLSYDDDIVFAAAWMHDLGVFVGHRPEEPEQLARWDNVIYACQHTPTILREFDFPEEKIAAVVDAIRTHQPHAEPRTIEGTILRDADILEQLGAVAIVRAMAKIGRDTRYPTHHEVIPVLEKALHELPQKLRLDSSCKLAIPRTESLRRFLADLTSESDLPA